MLKPANTGGQHLEVAHVRDDCSLYPLDTLSTEKTRPTSSASTRIRTASYWISTAIVAFAFLSGGLAYLAGAEVPLRGMAELGYPAYFVTILGVCKTLGALALVTPRFPRLKEWAYAGIAFDLLGAAASHAAVGDPAMKVAAPLIVLAIAAVSWSLTGLQVSFRR